MSDPAFISPIDSVNGDLEIDDASSDSDSSCYVRLYIGRPDNFSIRDYTIFAVSTAESRKAEEIKRFNRRRR